MDTPLGPLLRQSRRAKSMTLAKLAERVDVTPSYLSMVENQRVANPPSMKILLRIEAALAIRDSKLCRAAQWERTPTPIRDELARSRQSHAHTKPAVTSIPLINKVAAGYPAEFTDLGYPARISDDLILVPSYTGIHGSNDPDAFAATVCGDSMQPEYHEGDIVVFSPMADITNGSDCFARLEPNHESTFKRIYFEQDQNTIKLQPLNNQYPTKTIQREQISGLFRATWRMSKI